MATKYSPLDRAYLQANNLRCIKHYAEKIGVARAAGYDSLVEFVVASHILLGSTRKVGKLVGMSQSPVRAMLIRLEAATRKRGGPNNPYGRKGAPK